MLLRVFFVLVTCLAPLFAACDDSIACCRIRMMCDNCRCSSSLEAIGNDDDEAACEAALDDPDIADGCAIYRGTEAIRDCGGE